jgi:hypothetical protein
MKTVLSAILFAALSAGLAGTGFAQRYSACANNNSPACVEARNAFASHHGGAFPEQYYNHWYAGNQGRWYQQNNDWRWEGMNGDRYERGDRGWEWRRYHEEHEHDHDWDDHHHHHHHDHD